MDTAKRLLLMMGGGTPFDPQSLVDDGKIAAWYKDETDDYIVDQLGSQQREDFTQNSLAGQLFPGMSIQFAGNTDRAVVTDNGALDIGSNSAFSLSFWVKWDSFTGFSRVLGKIVNASTAGEYYLSTGGSAALFNVRGSGGLQSVTLISSVSTAVWYHVIFTIDASQVVRCYVNNVAIGTTPTVIGTIDAIANTHGFGLNTTVSSVSNTGTGYAGTTQFRDVRIFKGKVLSAQERTDVYDGKWVDGFTDWWPLSDNSTTRLHSAKEGGLHFVAVGLDAGSRQTGYWRQTYNRYGYAEDATYGQIPADLSALTNIDDVPTTDVYGNPLVFVGSAKQNLLKSSTDFTVWADASSTQLDTAINGFKLVSLNTWFTGSTPNAIAVADVAPYCGMKQFYNTATKELIIIKDDEELTATEESNLVQYMNISSRVHAYHATSAALFARFTNTVSDRDRSVYDNAIRLLQGHWAKYEFITNTAPYEEEMLLDWVSASYNLVEDGPRLSYVPYKGRAVNTDTWDNGFDASASLKFLQNDAFISFKHSNNLVIPTGASNVQMFGNGSNIGVWWDYDIAGSKRLRANMNSASAVAYNLGENHDVSKTVTLTRTSSTGTNVVSDGTQVTDNTATSNARSANPIRPFGWYQNYCQHFSAGQGMTLAETTLHNLVFDYFNYQMDVFAGEWIEEAWYRYKLCDKVPTGRIGQNIIWSDYKNLYYSTDNGVTVTASMAFDSGTLGWLHMVHIFDNGDVIFATNKNKMYGTTIALTEYSEIVVTKDGVTYTPHTPANANNPGEYYKFIGPKHKMYLDEAETEEIITWNAYSVSLRGAAPTLVLYSKGRSFGVKVAREFGQHPYIRDNGSSSGGTTGTLLGDAAVTRYVRHGHGVMQRKDDRTKFLAMYGDVDRALLAPALSAFMECGWEEGTYDNGLDTWAWVEITNTSPDERFKSTGGFFSETEVFWASDSDSSIDDEIGYFRSPIVGMDNKANHTRFYYPLQPDKPGNMFHLDDEMFFMGGGYAAAPGGSGYFFNDPNVIFGEMGGAFTEALLKVPGNVYIPVIDKIASGHYGLLIMSNYDYYRNAQYVEFQKL